jgi:hypothetical protein
MTPEDVNKVVPKIVKICGNPEVSKYFQFELKYVEMKTSPEVGRHWADLKEHDPWTNYSKLLNVA